MTDKEETIFKGAASMSAEQFERAAHSYVNFMNNLPLVTRLTFDDIFGAAAPIEHKGDTESDEKHHSLLGSELI